MTMNIPEVYSTSDMPLAAYLLCKNFIMEYVSEDTENAGRKYFCFSKKRGEKIEDVVKEYYDRKASVDPLEFFNNIKVLKNRLYR